MNTNTEKSDIPQFTRLSSYLAYELGNQSKSSPTLSSTKSVSKPKRRSILEIFALGVLALVLMGLFLWVIWLMMIQPINESLGELENHIDDLENSAEPRAAPPVNIVFDNQPPSIIVTDESQPEELVFRIVTHDSHSVDDGTVVHFEAVGGQIDPVALTRDGMAHTKFSPTRNFGDVIIIVSVEGVESAFTIPLIPRTLDRIEIVADRRWMLANGRDTTQITIRAIDDNGHPMGNVAIALRVEPGDTGSLSAHDITTVGNGEMTLLFTAGTREGLLAIIAEAQDGSGVDGRLELELVSDLTELIVTPSEINFWNSGNDEARLGIALKDGLDNFIPDRLVTLEITGTAEAWFLGENGQPITDSNTIARTTDAEGATSVWCRLGETPGEVVIVARVGEREERVTLNVYEFGPRAIEIWAGRMELAVDEQSNLSITVQDQRGAPVPDILVTLTMEPADMGEIATALVTGEDGSAPVIFMARSGGQVTITATVGESISKNIILTIFGDGDRDRDDRPDSREGELGTDPAIADDKVVIEGPLVGIGTPRLIFHVPVGVVLDRADSNSSQGSQAVKLQVWVKMEDLNQIGSGQSTLKSEAEITVAQEGFDQLLEVGPTIEGYLVRIIEGQVSDDWQLVEIEGLFPIANLDRP